MTANERERAGAGSVLSANPYDQVEREEARLNSTSQRTRG